jgi:Lrp/AsnC family transcriptional regulator, leucine-responsive regulatory protein
LTTTSAPLARLTDVASPTAEKVEVDDLDLTLLRALADDARQSQRALARAVGMSPPAIADRLARLERLGAIRGYRVDLDWAALGYPVVVYLAVTAGPGMDLSEIIRAIRELPEAQDMSVVTGGLDLLVRLRVRDHTIFASCFSARFSAFPASSAPRPSCRSPTPSRTTSR